MTPARLAVLERVARAVLALPSGRTLRVGIDGVDGAGKTMFADELREVLVPSGRPVIRAGVDWFHHPKSVRYRLGRHSPEGFYRDSYDYATLTRVLLDPLSPGGSGRFRRAFFDVDADVVVDSPEEQAAPGSILLFDGIFLHRPELRRISRRFSGSSGRAIIGCAAARIRRAFGTPRGKPSISANASPVSGPACSSTTMIWPGRSSSGSREESVRRV